MPRPALGPNRGPILWGNKHCQVESVEMDDAQEQLIPENQDLAEDALSSVGVGEVMEHGGGNAPHMQGDGNQGTNDELPVGVKERLGRQEKRHKREISKLRTQLESMMQQQAMAAQQAQQPQQGYGEPNSDVDAQIHKAVSLALAAQEEQKRKAKEQEQMHHVNQRYQSLNNDLDKASDKYEDFDDVVRAHDAPFTEAMRDAALFLENPAEVLYTIGKDKEELKRISKLPVVDQVREMIRLSHALMTGNHGKEAPKAASPRPIGQVKSYPVSHSGVNDKTPPSEIRRRMKAGEWKSNRY